MQCGTGRSWSLLQLCSPIQAVMLQCSSELESKLVLAVLASHELLACSGATGMSCTGIKLFLPMSAVSLQCKPNAVLAMFAES